MQLDANLNAQIPPAPLKPTCSWIFKTGPCADSWRNYNQAVQQRNLQVAQLYVNRQKQLAASQATAPLQQQITDLNKLTTDQQTEITKLNEQIQADSTAAMETKSADATATTQATATAHTQGLEQGTGIGVGASLVLFALIFGIKKLMSGFTVSKKPQARAASAS